MRIFLLSLLTVFSVRIMPIDYTAAYDASISAHSNVDILEVDTINDDDYLP